MQNSGNKKYVVYNSNDSNTKDLCGQAGRPKRSPHNAFFNIEKHFNVEDPASSPDKE